MAFGLALRALGHADPDIVALDGDVSNSTYTKYFANDESLHERFFECSSSRCACMCEMTKQCARTQHHFN